MSNAGSSRRSGLHSMSLKLIDFLTLATGTNTCRTLVVGIAISRSTGLSSPGIWMPSDVVYGIRFAILPKRAEFPTMG